MSHPIIKSRSNPLIVTARSVRDGKEKGFIFCEGIKLIDELLLSSLHTTNIFCVAKFEGPLRKSLDASGKMHVPISVVDKGVMEALSDLDTPAGAVALARRPEGNKGGKDKDQENGDLFLVLPKVQLPQNLGAMIRSCEAVGVSGVWLGPESADPFSSKTIRGSTGSVFRVPVRRGVELSAGIKELKEKGVRVLAATQQGKKFYDQVDWTEPTALVLGAEGSGFSKEQLSLFDETIKIPMKGKVESLNLGTAAGICLFEALRQRRNKAKGVSVGS